MVICIDSPDFNYNLVKSLRKKNLIIKLYKLLHLQFGPGDPAEQKILQKYIMKFFFYLILKKKYFNYPNLKTLFIGHPIFHIKKKNKPRL